MIFKKCHILQFCSINENPCFFFFIISLVIFGLQRCTLSQIKALEILFWPYVIIFSPRINICWAITSRSCIICFRVAQTVFVPNFYIPLIWQLFFFFLWIFSSYAKELMHMISRKKKLCIWYHFIKQNFQIHFVNVFLTHPLKSDYVKFKNLDSGPDGFSAQVWFG